MASIKVNPYSIIDILDNKLYPDAYQFLYQCFDDQYVDIFKFIQYKGVDIYLLDMTSHLLFGTFKSFIGATCVAHMIQNNHHEVVITSSGNTGNSIIGYANALGIKSHYFLPKQSLFKVNPDLYNSTYNILYSIDGLDTDVKRAAEIFSKELNLFVYPVYDLQIYSNRMRYNLIKEWQKVYPIPFHWTSQALSGGYGPIGLYKAYEDHKSGIEIIPKFLGIQQEMNCPFYSHIVKNRHMKTHQKRTLNVPTLYNTNPGRCLDDMKWIIDSFGGSIITVSDELFSKYATNVIKVLNEKGISLTQKTVYEKQVYLELSGLYSIIGTISAIETNIVKKGENVLVAFTGGCEKQTQSIVQADFEIQDFEKVESFVDRIIKGRKVYENTYK